MHRSFINAIMFLLCFLPAFNLAGHELKETSARIEFHQEMLHVVVTTDLQAWMTHLQQGVKLEDINILYMIARQTFFHETSLTIDRQKIELQIVNFPRLEEFRIRNHDQKKEHLHFGQIHLTARKSPPQKWNSVTLQLPKALGPYVANLVLKKTRYYQAGTPAVFSRKEFTH